MCYTLTVSRLGALSQATADCPITQLTLHLHSSLFKLHWTSSDPWVLHKAVKKSARGLSNLCKACLLLGLFKLDACEVLLGPRAYKMCYEIAVLCAPLLL